MDGLPIPKGIANLSWRRFDIFSYLLFYGSSGRDIRKEIHQLLYFLMNYYLALHTVVVHPFQLHYSERQVILILYMPSQVEFEPITTEVKLECWFAKV